MSSFYHGRILNSSWGNRCWALVSEGGRKGGHGPARGKFKFRFRWLQGRFQAQLSLSRCHGDWGLGTKCMASCGAGGGRGVCGADWHLECLTPVSQPPKEVGALLCPFHRREN